MITTARTKPTDAPKLPTKGIALISVDDIATDPRQPRTHFDETELQALADSLKAAKLLQPIGVRLVQGQDTPYLLIWGERRLRAARLAGLRKIPARIRQVSDVEALLEMGDENLLRDDWNPIEMAKYIDCLTKPETEGGAGLTVTDVATRYGKTRPWAAHLRRLLKLPETWQQRVTTGELSERAARALVPFADKPRVLNAIAKDMKENPWAWRTGADVERNAPLIAEKITGKPPQKTFTPSDPTETETTKENVRDRAVATEPEQQPSQPVGSDKPTKEARQSANAERLSQLAESFPSLAGQPGVRPWDADKLFHVAMHGRSRGQRLAALFCLQVWNTDEATRYTKEAFNLIEAVRTWDVADVDALRMWLDNPFLL